MEELVRHFRMERIIVIFKLKGYQKILEERRSLDNFFDSI